LAATKKYKSVIGLGIHLKPDDSASYHVLELSNKADTLLIGMAYQVENLGQLVKVIGKSQPIVAVIYGHGILDKHIQELVPGETGISKKAIPGLNLDEYYTSEHSYSNHGWVSLTKREKVEDILVRLDQQGLSVIDMNIGITGLCPLIGLLDLDNQVVVENYTEVLKAQSENHKYKHRSKTVLQLGLGILLLLALGNAYFFNEAYQQNERIAHNVNIQRPLLDKVSELKSQKDQLEKAIGPLNVSKTNHAFRIDHIGATLDKSKIILKSIDLYPLSSDRKKVNAGDFQFDNNQIVIEGISSNPRLFGEWVSEVRALDWVVAVDISPFKKNVQGKDEFVVVLGLK